MKKYRPGDKVFYKSLRGPVKAIVERDANSAIHKCAIELRVTSINHPIYRYGHTLIINEKSAFVTPRT